MNTLATDMNGQTLLYTLTLAACEDRDRGGSFARELAEALHADPATVDILASAAAAAAEGRSLNLTAAASELREALNLNQAGIRVLADTALSLYMARRCCGCVHDRGTGWR